MSELKNFLSWRGTLPRLPYFLWGIGLLALKHNIDRAIAYFLFNEQLWFYNYYDLPTRLEDNYQLYFTLALLALPFIFIGIGLTLKRLRSADLPTLLILLFFPPVINLLFFAMLCFWPERTSEKPETLPREKAFLSRWIPESKTGAALASIGVMVVLTLPIILISVMGLGEYGVALFMGLPFASGLVTTVFFATHQSRSFKECLAISFLGLGLLGLAIVLVAIEGVICVMMALPLASMLNLMGAWAGWLIQSRRRPLPGQGVLVMFFVPGLMGLEKAIDLPPPRLEVTSVVEIQAPPEVVWENVVSFSELPPPKSWILNTGVAYPIKAEIKGHGVGAVRHCIFSTGPFVEPIEVWDEPRLLKFSVIKQPHPMKELTPYKIAPPHLDHFLRSKAGQFKLTALPNGGTRLAGTTWYEHEIWPAAYWQIWSDFVIHEIHHSVLDHIKNLSEA